MDSVNDRNLRVKEHLCSGNEYLMPFTKKRRLSSLGPPPQGDCVLPSTPPPLPICSVISRMQKLRAPWWEPFTFIFPKFLQSSMVQSESEFVRVVGIHFVSPRYDPSGLTGRKTSSIYLSICLTSLSRSSPMALKRSASPA